MISINIKKDQTIENIESFIADIRKHTPESVHLFTKGYCFYFCSILKVRFLSYEKDPWTYIYYDQIDDHFYTKINGNYYDINGLLKDEKIKDRLELFDRIGYEDELLYDRIIRDDILKNNQ